MQFSFTEDQKMLRDTVRDVFARECSPDVVRGVWEKGSGHAPAVWKTLADTGVIGMGASEATGGQGMNEVDWLLVLEEAGYAALPGPIVETLAVGIPLLDALGTPAQKERWMPSLISGQSLVTICFESQGLVPHAALADFVFVEKNRHFHLAPPEALRLQTQLAVDRALSISTLEHQPDEAQHLRDDEKGERALAFERAVLGTSAVLIGLSRRMLDMSVQYAKDREQFGKPIGAQQAVKHHLANALIKQEFARPLVYRAAWSLAERAEGYARDVSMAKIYATEAAQFVAKQALQVHGAIGYTIECDLHMWMKRVWALAATYGDIAWHRDRVANAVLS